MGPLEVVVMCSLHSLPVHTLSPWSNVHKMQWWHSCRWADERWCHCYHCPFWLALQMPYSRLSLKCMTAACGRGCTVSVGQDPLQPVLVVFSLYKLAYSIMCTPWLNCNHSVTCGVFTLPKHSLQLALCGGGVYYSYLAMGIYIKYKYLSCYKISYLYKEKVRTWWQRQQLVDHMVICSCRTVKQPKDNQKARKNINLQWKILS